MAVRDDITERVREHPGSTTDEIATAVGVTHATAVRHLRALEHDGLARKGSLKACSASSGRGRTWWPGKTS